MRIKAIAIDDEPLALEKLISFARKTPSINLLATFENPLEALLFLKTNPVDLVFLDIQMDELSGLGFMDALTEKPSIIITSAYAQYAVKGYDYDVADYLLKPFSFDRYLQAIGKIQNEERKEKTDSVSVFIKSGYTLRQINVDSILYIKGMGEYLQIATTKASIMTLSSFAQIQAILPAGNFIRIHKSYMVAIDKIRYVGSTSVVMQGGINVPIGKSYKAELRNVLNSL